MDRKIMIQRGIAASVISIAIGSGIGYYAGSGLQDASAQQPTGQCMLDTVEVVAESQAGVGIDGWEELAQESIAYAAYHEYEPRSITMMGNDGVFPPSLLILFCPAR